MAEPMAPPDHWVPEDSFAVRLVLLRRQLGLTQTQAAELCGLDDGSWSNWENGAKPRGMDRVVRKIADATGVDPGWLMWGGPLRAMTLWIAPDYPQAQQLDLLELLTPPPMLTVLRGA